MGKIRTPIGKFVHTSWNNMNIRAGKYRHLQTKSKCKVYENIIIEFTREEYKNWCYINKERILLLARPSVDRIDRTKNYTLDNIQIIELVDNIRKKRAGSAYLNGPLSDTVRGVDFQRNRWRARIRQNGKEIHLGSFKNKEEALEVFYNKYIEIYGKAPWNKNSP